ncbi:MAG: hypothetical protein JZU47_13765 [Prolixibacteraceae bacterium]|nr:hypothetical protein [Prolixibacteraceae bacterium]
MNASYFVLVAALLAFATGFFVAAIIWSIRWFLTPREERVVSSKSVHLLHIFSKNELHNTLGVAVGSNKSGLMNNDSVSNMELYRYYHGKN